MTKNLSDKLFWIALVLIGIYLLYQKGIIGTDFKSVTPKEAYKMIQNDNNITLLDVRTVSEYKKDGRIAGAKLIPLNQLSKNLNMLEKSKKVLVYCRSGNRSISAARILENNGFTVINMSGGIMAWKSANLPLSMESH